MFGYSWQSETVIALAIVINVLLFAVSLVLTLHILLNKSDPKASLMWIVLIWFAPLFGAVFYLLFGINRINRRVKKLLVDAHIKPIAGLSNDSEDLLLKSVPYDFLRLADSVTDLSRTQGNAVEIMQGVDTAHSVMIDAISSAETTIFLSTYIFRRDPLGKAVANALVEADQRGVDVKVLLDGVGNGLFRSRIYRQLKKGGVDVHRFLHSSWPWRMPLLNLRNHRKILIIDGHLGFTGSLNIGYVKNLETHFCLKGPILNHLETAFDLDWQIAGGALLKDRALPPTNTALGTVSARGILSGPIYKRERLRWILLGAMASAHSHIRIVTPYFIPDQGLLSGLVTAALRGVRVEILLPKHSNYRFADWAGQRQLQELLRAGCHVFLREDVFDHSKLMTVDGRWALIGSSNWDARSLRLNFEFDIECDDPGFAAELEAMIDRRVAKSTRLRIEAFETRSIFLKLRDAAARLFLPYL